MARGDSLYAKLRDDLLPQYGKRIISDDETIQMLLSMLYQHTGINYVPEADMDAAYDKGYRNGCQEAEEKCAAQRRLRYQQGFEEGIKGKVKFANDRAEEAYTKGHRQGIKDAWQKFDQGTSWDDGYQQGKRDADAKHQVLIAKAERTAHDAGFADGYAKGIKQGKKEVVDFINNMKVSQ